MPRRPRRVLVALAALAPLAGVPACAPEPPTPLCARDEVLRIVDRTVRGWNRYNRILENTAAEAPTAVANSVVCQIEMASIGYDWTAAGWIARESRELRRYDVQVIDNRLRVQVPP